MDSQTIFIIGSATTIPKTFFFLAVDTTTTAEALTTMNEKISTVTAYTFSAKYRHPFVPSCDKDAT